jgi:ABC-type polar amino acid transport system ATPase subunit
MGKYKKRTFKFIGKHDYLVSGKEYTLRDYSNALAVPVELIKKQFKFRNHYNVITNVTLYPFRLATNSRLETKAEALSQKWLRKKLV